MDPGHLAALTKDISRESEVLIQLLEATSSRDSPDDNVGRHPLDGLAIEQSQSKLLGLAERLDRLLRGPSNVLHEFVASNWDRGALYCLLEHDMLELIPLDGTATLAELAAKTSVPSDKLLAILRLSVCGGVIQEPAAEVFRHGPISRELTTDPGLKAFIGFQLFETRVASAHLADSLKQPNPYWSGQSAFEYAHPEKGMRFGDTMKGVTSSMDPGIQLLRDWFRRTFPDGHDTNHVFFEVTRFPRRTPHFLAEEYSGVSFEEQKFPEEMTHPAIDEGPDAPAHIYYLNSILWNLPDEDCIIVLRVFLTPLETLPNSVLVVNDLMSPPPGTFEPHVDKAYRRRDVTVMTMHNAKVRTEEEWLEIFHMACPNFKTARSVSLTRSLQIKSSIGYTSHSCRAQWEITWNVAKTE
ncbi:hypothetical protein EDB81DRAFT_657909 [Dactylonectria macrodidyma]|uniref:O-methyltransferase domain-containing protein n=1 Tax=Dactylonectria macrodidyma TaxID=307937 RepID=A0A9P9ED70_9HYPO|nr:hypothetical protein EDB81DRAFT_657909 [Dactylonectria macrodidyma]